MKKILVKCECCGFERETFSRAKKCAVCDANQRYSATRTKVVKQLEGLGNVDVRVDGLNAYDKVSITFTHPVCGTTQNWSIINLQARLKKIPTVSPCSCCGAKSRMKNARIWYAAKYGLDETKLAEWDIYRKVSRRLSDQNYRKYKNIINPLDLPRGVDTYHLDHKIPLIYGFKNNLSAEQIATVENLQMLPAKENLRKARKTFKI